MTFCHCWRLQYQRMPALFKVRNKFAQPPLTTETVLESRLRKYIWHSPLLDQQVLYFPWCFSVVGVLFNIRKLKVFTCFCFCTNPNVFYKISRCGYRDLSGYYISLNCQIETSVKAWWISIMYNLNFQFKHQFKFPVVQFLELYYGFV